MRNHAPNPHVQQMLAQRHDYSSGKSCHSDVLYVHKEDKLSASLWVNFSDGRFLSNSLATVQVVMLHAGQVEIVVIVMPLIFGQSLLILCMYRKHLKLCFVVIL